MKNNNQRKRGGLVLLGISLLMSLLFKGRVYALELTNSNPYNYTYTNNGKVYPLYLAVNNESKRALFQERGNVEFIDTSTYVVRNEKYGLEPYEFNALYLATIDNSVDKLLAMQIYLFEDFARRNKDTLSFSFDPKPYYEISESLLKQGKEMIKEKKYSYKIKQGEWTFIPKEWEGNYEISLNSFPLQLDQREDGFYIRGVNLGTYETEIDIKNESEYGNYFDSKHYKKSNYIEAIKPCVAHNVLSIEVIPPIYDIHIPSNPIGYELDIVSNSLKEEAVSYNLVVDEDYLLKDFKITKEDGSEIITNDNSFIMPNSDVYVDVLVEQKSYNIKTINSKEVIISCASMAKVNELVNFDIKVLDGYELTDVYVNDKEIDLNNLSFVMPNEEVTIKANVRKKRYQISLDNPNVKVNVSNALFNDLVNLVVIPDEGYEISSIKIVSNSGKEIEYLNNSFIMPSGDVLIKVETKAKRYQISLDNPNVKVNVSNALFNDLVNLVVIPDDGYEINSIKIVSNSGKEIEYLNNSFIMPNENVKLIIETNKEKYQISYLNDRNIKFLLDSEYEWGTLVNLKYMLDDNYLLDFIKLKTLSGEEILIKDNQFMMPKEDVFLSFNVKEKLYKVVFVDEDDNELAKPLYLKDYDIFQIPFFDDYETITIYDDEQRLGLLLSDTYLLQSNLKFVYSNKIEETLEEDDEYVYEEIPNTLEKGFEPLFGFLTIALFIYFKKYLCS